MVEIESYLASLTAALKREFGTRLCYVGLQGSYLRGEATEHSDIDVMVILDGLTAEDLARYRALVEQTEEPEKACGFICGRAEMAHWNPLEICHLLHTTRDIFGTLRDFVPPYTQEDILNYIKLSLGNLYHGLCHTRIHAPEQALRQSLPELYKQTFFILQNLHCLRTGDFCRTKKELLAQLSGEDHAALQWEIDHRGRDDWELDGAFKLLFTWCQNTLNHLTEF